MDENKALGIIEEYVESYKKRIRQLIIVTEPYRGLHSMLSTYGDYRKELDDDIKYLKKQLKIISNIEYLVEMYKTIAIEKQICLNVISSLNTIKFNKECFKYKKKINTFIDELSFGERDTLRRLRKILEKNSKKIIIDKNSNSLYQRIICEFYKGYNEQEYNIFEIFIKDLEKEIKNSIQEICSLENEINDANNYKYSYNKDEIIKRIEKLTLDKVQHISLIYKTNVEVDQTKLKKLQYIFYQILELCKEFSYLKPLSVSITPKLRGLKANGINLTEKCLTMCCTPQILSIIYLEQILNLMNDANGLLLETNLGDIFKSINIIKYNQMNIIKFENTLYINCEDRLKLENDKQEIIEVLKKYPKFSELIYLENLISKNKQYIK